MSLKLSLITSDPLTVSADVAVIGVIQGASLRAGSLGALAKAIGPAFQKAIRVEEFTGKKDQTLEISTQGFSKEGKLKPQKIVLMGLGAGELTCARVRTLAAKAARLAQNARAKTLALEIPLEADGAVRAAAEGAVLGAYRFTKYLTGDRLPKSSLEKVTLTTRAKVTKDLRDAVDTGRAVGECIYLARDLINEPPNELYPEVFAKICQEMSKERGLKCTVLDKPALTKKGMKLLLAVSQGSVREPRLIHMVYTPAPLAKGAKPKRLVFIGKGLTFDSGGLCIKPAQGMEEMKGDMGGAANVAALMAAVAVLKPQVEVHGIIGSVENMPDGAAYRPGDIFGSLDGKTVEIINTDAEGRLVLADVLAYGRELKPDLMLDNATLTGACVVALGTSTSGFFASQDELADRMKTCAEEAGESMWHLPLLDELRDGLKSDWADLKHTADRWGGAITAALFLREFIGDAPWVHVDVAGPSLAHRALGIHPKGGTGHGVLTFLKVIESYESKA